MTRGRSHLGPARLARAGVLALVLSAGCATAPAPLPVSDRNMTVSEGATFTVTLDRRAGTGYGWSVDGADAQTVTLVNRLVERDVSMPGAPEREVFVFLAKRAGTATLRFTYGRPWEAASPPAVTRAYRVQVDRC